MGFFEDIDVNAMEGAETNNSGVEFDDETLVNEDMNINLDALLQMNQTDSKETGSIFMGQQTSPPVEQNNKKPMEDNVIKEALVKEEPAKENHSPTKNKEVVKNTGKEEIPASSILTDPSHKKEKEPGYPVNYAQGSTLIATGSVVEGNVRSNGGLSVDGEVIGSVSAQGPLTIFKHGIVRGDVTGSSSVEIHGTVGGNIVGKAVKLEAKRIDGDITSGEELVINGGTVLVGNVKASSASIAGAVKGNIEVTGRVILSATAVVKGNVKASAIQIEVGAIVDGGCIITATDKNVDDIFA